MTTLKQFIAHNAPDHYQTVLQMVYAYGISGVAMAMCYGPNPNTFVRWLKLALGGIEPYATALAPLLEASRMRDAHLYAQQEGRPYSHWPRCPDCPHDLPDHKEHQ